MDPDAAERGALGVTPTAAWRSPRVADDGAGGGAGSSAVGPSTRAAPSLRTNGGDSSSDRPSWPASRSFELDPDPVGDSRSLNESGTGSFGFFGSVVTRPRRDRGRWLSRGRGRRRRGG